MNLWPSAGKLHLGPQQTQLPLYYRSCFPLPLRAPHGEVLVSEDWVLKLILSWSITHEFVYTLKWFLLDSVIFLLFQHLPKIINFRQTIHLVEIPKNLLELSWNFRYYWNMIFPIIYSIYKWYLKKFLGIFHLP